MARVHFCRKIQFWSSATTVSLFILNYDYFIIANVFFTFCSVAITVTVAVVLDYVFFSSLRSIYYAFAQLLSVERIWDNALKLTHKWPGLCWFQLRDSFCWPCLKAYGIFDLYTVYTVQVRTQRASVLTIDKKKYADPAVMFCFVFVSLLSTFSQQHFWLTQLQKRDFQVSHVEKYSFSQWFLVFFFLRSLSKRPDKNYD